jgi:hypothetical protein
MNYVLAIFAQCCAAYLATLQIYLAEKLSRDRKCFSKVFFFFSDCGKRYECFFCCDLVFFLIVMTGKMGGAAAQGQGHE